MAQKNAQDPAEIARQERINKIKRDQYLADMHWLLGDPRGRRIIWALLGIARVFEISFTGDSKTYFYEGKRDVGLSILRDVMESRPEAYQQMSEESKKGEENA